MIVKIKEDGRGRGGWKRCELKALETIGPISLELVGLFNLHVIQKHHKYHIEI